jgi:hypothetical protein
MIRQARPDLPPDGGDMIAPEDIGEIILFLLSLRNNAISMRSMFIRRKKEPFL